MGRRHRLPAADLSVPEPLPTSAGPERWDKILLPRRGLFDLPIGDLWHYRDLIWLLARRNITAQYKQTVLGPAWFIIQPLLVTVVFSFIFGRMAGLGTDRVPHFLFYMSGLVLFNFLSECISKTSMVFLRNAHIFGKVYFPRLAVPLAQTLTSLSTFAIQFGIFLVGLAFYLVKMRVAPDPAHPITLDPNWRIVLLPLLLGQIALFGVGAGLIVAALTTRYRDLQMAVPFVVQLCMYASSIVFPLSRIKESAFIALLKLNPLVPAVEAFRYAFLGEGMVTKADLVVSLALCAAIFALGLIMFSRTERTVADTV